MPFVDDARRATAGNVERELRKLVDNVSNLVKDMKDVKAELSRLEKENRKLRGDVDFLARNAAGEAK